MRSLALLVASLSVTVPALALDDEGPETCTSDVSLEVWIDDELTPRCEAVFGGLEQRDANDAWAERRNVHVSDRGRLVDILHSDARFKRPVRRALPGMTVLDVRPAMVAEEDCTEELVPAPEPAPVEEGEPATDGAKGADAATNKEGEDDEDDPEDEAEDDEIDESEEMVAVVQLSDAWRDVCGTERIIVREGDSLGAGGRVVWIGRRGMLTHLGGRLAWVPRTGARDPEFRLTWRAGFAISMEKASKLKKRKRKRRNRRRRRKRRR